MHVETGTKAAGYIITAIIKLTSHLDSIHPSAGIVELITKSAGLYYLFRSNGLGAAGFNLSALIVHSTYADWICALGL